ncbi:MAG: uracil phosphoribosyltransferase [Myxococcales bacterium]|nr:uracil phosphoribosyltransferase [Myxococcales bacterium]
MSQKPYRISEIEHHYGEGVHILHDPFLTTQLARLCGPETTQPLFNQLIVELYTSLIRTVINQEFPQHAVEMDTRMRATTPNGVFRGEIVDRSTPTVVVDIARAGILPSQICYDTLNGVLDPRAVRQDHLIMARTTDAQDKVTGAAISGSKIGGKVDDCFVLFPDPMGATGNSLVTAMESYAGGALGRPRRLITLNLIVTPQFVRRLKQALPEVVIYAVRLDRGMSPPDVLATTPGARWDEESGLDDHQYIVPGGGGFGELMNNSWI